MSQRELAIHFFGKPPEKYEGRVSHILDRKRKMHPEIYNDLKQKLATLQVSGSQLEELARLKDYPERQKEIYEWVKHEEPSVRGTKIIVDKVLQEEKWVPKEVKEGKTRRGKEAIETCRFY